MEDIRVMRKSYGAVSVRSVTTTPSVIADASDNRVALIISSPDGADMFISTNPNVTITTGFRINSGQSPLMLDLQSHGGVVTQAWYGVFAAVTEGIGVIESFLEAK